MSPGALPRFSLDPSPELAQEGGKPSIIRVLPLSHKVGADGEMGKRDPKKSIEQWVIETRASLDCESEAIPSHTRATELGAKRPVIGAPRAVPARKATGRP